MADKGAAKAQKPAKTDKPDEPELGYEESREELNTVVRRLEAGGLSLKDSLALWERGEELARICERWLEGARATMAAAMDEREKDDAPGNADTPF
ncbi:exodeoxyribonuclease VII small subunit [Nocardiopsis sp. N85]|uniref:exodeoxyribonuclease VII small subunit n=1 Tax=Nocardiopsis sp. N85 TaxID=3029400 RepID=UPI00237F8E3D|nr:exodeoxyribonuclease VII small subunit [Nocardiopsis sp. N85]MDE3721716.1 exodeoxyribonuclease VII small subunit [Nocardiopsis sp. N85]